MSWSSSTRGSRLPSNWASVRGECLRRANFRCEHVREDTLLPCGKWANQVDHVIPDFEGGSDDSSNLMALCEYHHMMKTQRESGRARRRLNRRRREAERYRHPAFL